MSLVQLAHPYEIIYSTGNHASGRRGNQFAPDIAHPNARGQTAEMAVPAAVVFGDHTRLSFFSG
jgi:hypothetical protein